MRREDRKMSKALILSAVFLFAVLAAGEERSRGEARVYRVLDEAGAVPAGLEAMLLPSISGDGFTMPFPPPVSEVIDDLSANAGFRALKTGRVALKPVFGIYPYKLIFRAPGRALTVVQSQGAPNAQDVKVVMKKGHSLRVRFQIAGAKGGEDPSERLIVRAFSEKMAPFLDAREYLDRDLYVAPPGLSDADGTIQLEGVADDDFFYFAVAGAGVRRRIVGPYDVLALRQSPVLLQRGARLTGRYALGGIGAYSRILLEPISLPDVEESKYVDEAKFVHRQRAFSAAIGRDGTYTFDGLPPGDYNLWYRDGLRRRATHVTLREGRTVLDIDERLGAWREEYRGDRDLRGRMLSIGGRPVAGERVYIWPVDTFMNPEPVGDVLTDGDGWFEFAGLRSMKSYILTLTPDRKLPVFNYPFLLAPAPPEGKTLTLIKAFAAGDEMPVYESRRVSGERFTNAGLDGRYIVLHWSRANDDSMQSLELLAELKRSGGLRDVTVVCEPHDDARGRADFLSAVSRARAGHLLHCFSGLGVNSDFQKKIGARLGAAIGVDRDGKTAFIAPNSLWLRWELEKWTGADGQTSSSAR